jgi:CHAT domain-containing protein/Tfp pilus assembly protein PilF
MDESRGKLPLLHRVCFTIFTTATVLALADLAQGTAESPAQTAMTRGRAAFDKGNFEAAAAEWESAAKQFARAKDNVSQVSSLVSLAGAYQSLGQHKLASDTLDSARGIATKAGDRAGILAVKSSFGSLLTAMRRDDEAEKQLREALEMARADKDTRATASILNNLGTLLSDLGRAPEALAAFQEAESLAQDAASPLLAARAACNAAAAAGTAGRDADAMRLNEAAIARVTPLAASHDKALLLLRAGQTDWTLSQRLADAKKSLLARCQNSDEQALQIADQLGNTRLKSYALGYLGEVVAANGDTGKAVELTRQAAFAAQQAQAPDALYLWEWQRGRLLRAQGDRAGAIAAYRRALQTLQSVRFDLTAGCCGGRGSFRESVGPLYFELADVLLLQADAMQDPQQRERVLREARDTVEQLKGVELQDYFQDECVRQFRSKRASIENLDPRTAVVYIIPLPDRTELLVSLPSGLQRFKAPVGTAELTAEVRLFRRELEKRTTFEFFEHGEKLYNWLIRPMKDALAKADVNTLVFVPDGALRTIPMAALFDGENYLIQEFAVAVAPGLTLVEPRPIHRENATLLLNGLSQSVQGFTALDNVPRELESLRPLYRSEILLDQAFLTSRVEKKFTEEQFAMVHIASHGQFEPDARKTFVLTYDGRLTLDQLEAIIRPGRFRGRPVELLTLSACQTAAGDDRAALGLAGVAVKAGARSALATLWFVNDESTSILVREFYSHLRNNPTLSKATALQSAQLALIGDRRYRHPCYWAPYLIIGNWL